jgi:hypothetical protein
VPGLGEGLGQGDGKLLWPLPILILRFSLPSPKFTTMPQNSGASPVGGDGDLHFLPGANGARLDLDRADAARSAKARVEAKPKPGQNPLHISWRHSLV